MASFDENGKYIKTNWKAGDKITSTKLNKIEESIEAVNDNDISRHVEADTRLDALEAKDVAHDKELTNIKKTIADNKAAAELGDYDINSRMTFLENELNEGIEALNEGIEEVHNVAETVDGKIATAEANMSNAVNTAKTEMTTQVNTAKTEMTTQVNTAKTEMTAQVNQGKADMEAMVNDVVDAITPIASDLSSYISEELTNNSVTSFKAGTSNVTGIDLTEQMEQSIVSLDNIEGKTEFVENITDPPYRLKNTCIKLLYTLDENDTTNYFDNKNITSSFSDTTYTLDGNNIRVTTTSSEARCIDVEVYGLEPGGVYRLYADDVQITHGGSVIGMYSDTNGRLISNSYANHSDRPNRNSNGLVARVGNNTLKFYFYVNFGNDSQGDVSYNGITLRKVKEYTYADLTLRSLPNGVKDEIKDGKLIKRVESYRLNGSEDWVIADNSKTNTISFACPLSNAIPVNKEVISLNSNKYKTYSDAELYTEDTIGLAIGGLNSSQLLFRVDRGINSVEKLKYHLATGEKDIVIEYEIKEEIYDIDLSIVCDPDDIVYIDTNRSISCSHQVQLSTKSQVEETQKQIVKSNKSIWQRLKELTEKVKNLTDVKMQMNENGYIKFPTALGGLLIQWGSVANTPGNPEIRIDLPIAYSERIYTIQFTGQWGYANNHYWVSSNTDYKTFITPMKIGSPDVINAADPVYWLTIGK